MSFDGAVSTDASAPKYLIDCEPSAIRRYLSSNVISGSPNSVNAPRNSFRSYTPNSCGKVSDTFADAYTDLAAEIVLSLDPGLISKFPLIVAKFFNNPIVSFVSFIRIFHFQINNKC